MYIIILKLSHTFYRIIDKDDAHQKEKKKTKYSNFNIIFIFWYEIIYVIFINLHLIIFV